MASQSDTIVTMLPNNSIVSGVYTVMLEAEWREDCNY